MTPSQVKCFLTVVETGSFSSAANVLFIAQPAVSIQIKTIEAEIGFPLFIRKGRSIEVTDEGKLLYDTIKECHSLYNQAINKCLKQVNKGSDNKVLKIGCPYLWNKHTALQKLNDYVKASFPWINIEVKGYKQADIIEALTSGDLDLALHITEIGSQKNINTFIYDNVKLNLTYSAESDIGNDISEIKNINNYNFLVMCDLLSNQYQDLFNALKSWFHVDYINTTTIHDAGHIRSMLLKSGNIALANELCLWTSDPELKVTPIDITRNLYLSYSTTSPNIEAALIARQLSSNFLISDNRKAQ